MSALEYLQLFSGNGDIKVRVKFKRFDGVIGDQRMTPHEIKRLVSTENEEFISNMLFDEMLFDISRYEIDPQNKVLTIHAEQSREEDR